MKQIVSVFHHYDLARLPNSFLGIVFERGSLPSAIEFFSTGLVREIGYGLAVSIGAFVTTCSS